MTETTNEVCSTGFLTHTHDTGDDQHILCLMPCDCGKPTILPILFNEGEIVTLSLRAPSEDDARGAKDEHPRIDVHLNPGDEIAHGPCLTFDACGPCFTNVWESVFSNGGARIGVHADPEHPENVLFAPFRIGDWRETREAVKTVQSRMIVSN